MTDLAPRYIVEYKSRLGGTFFIGVHRRFPSETEPRVFNTPGHAKQSIRQARSDYGRLHDPAPEDAFKILKVYLTIADPDPTPEQ